MILCRRRLLTFVNISRLASLSTDLLFLEKQYYRFPSWLQWFTSFHVQNTLIHRVGVAQ